MTTDDSVGYCKPPKAWQFKKGICPNPKGRGKKKETQYDTVIKSVLNESMPYREGAFEKRATALELLIKKIFYGAVNGQVSEAEKLLHLYSQASSSDSGELIEITIKGVIPDDMTIL